jgi:hydroxymethylglutaryl-CoA lyase
MHNTQLDFKVNDLRINLYPKLPTRFKVRLVPKFSLDRASMPQLKSAHRTKSPTLKETGPTMNYPKKVIIGDITIRDGFQHEEKFIPTEAKLWLAEQLISAGFKHLEVTNFGNPKGMPQFKDADTLFKQLRTSKKLGPLLDGVSLTGVTIREKAVERAIRARQEGWGPDRILLMVSTSESHHKTNSGLTLQEYWKMSEEWIKKANDAGIKVNGTVSTIWGCPIEGPTKLNKAIEFTRRWFDIGAYDVEHADHDGSASPDRVYDYFARLLDTVGNPHKQIAHFHTTRGWGLANVLAALQAGMIYFESTMGGLGGQPANFVDGVPVSGTGRYYYKDSSEVGLVSTEDMVVMMDEMGIDTGLDIDRLLEIGDMVERIVGRRLRSESIKNGRIPKVMKSEK